jgi:hypothetical protein
MFMVAAHIAQPRLGPSTDDFSLHSDDQVTHETWVPLIFVVILSSVSLCQRKLGY